MIQSHNGVLNATLVEQTGPLTVDGQSASNATTFNGLFPGPTLQFNPGDQVNIDLVNHLTPAAGLSYGPTNLHLHGLHVSPDGNADNVFLEIDPGQQNEYHYDIPANHPEGLYWYHPHHHGLVSPQIWSGLSGMLIVGRADGGAPELNGLAQRVLGLKNFQVDPATHQIPPQADEDPNQSLFTVNGLVNPTMTIRPGEAQVWSMADMSNDVFWDMALVNSKGVRQTLYVVAEDGQPLTRPEAVTDLQMSPGKRWSFIVEESPHDRAGTTYSFENVGFFDGEVHWPVRTLATLQVAGTPVTPFRIPTRLSPANNFYHDLSNAPIAQHRVVTFSQTDTSDLINGQAFPDPPVFQARLNTVEEWDILNVTPDIHVFHIHQNDFQIMSVNGTPVPANGTPVFVPGFAYPGGGPSQGETMVGGALADTVDVPAANPVTGEPGKVVIRMEFKDFTGKYVYHCHIVDHEDMGMMATINVVPNDPLYAAGAGEGAPPMVHVYDSLTGQLKTSFLAFDPKLVTGGVTVAVANLYGDNRQQIVVGAGPGGPPLVRVFDENGRPLPGILGQGFLAYDRHFQGGVNVAVGDVNGDGVQDIITGEGAGPSSKPLVRAFSGKDGSELLDFLAFEQSFHGGVTVAAADVTGNGRTQIIAGRGPGSTPEVKVFRASDQHVMDDFLAYDQSFHGGVYLATGWVKGFAFPDLIVGAGPGLAEARVFSNLMTMHEMLAHNMNDMVDLTLWKQVAVPGFLTGVHVATRFDANGTGDDLLAAPGPSHAPTVRVYQTNTLAPDDEFLAFPPSYVGGVNFGAAGAAVAPPPADVLQYHNDAAGTGQNLSETLLTPETVNPVSFGKLFSTPVDGQVYAQPLFLAGVSVAGGTHNVVFVATEHDSVYAIDADNGAVLWRRNFLQAGERTLTPADVGIGDISPQIGITGTPVLDPATGTLYFVTKATTAPPGTNASTSDTVQRLHAVDIRSGKEKFGGPVVIRASVNGTGDGNDGRGHVPFDPLRNNQRAALTLSGGVVYIAWSSHGDNEPFHGWVIGYNASTLRQAAAFNDTPNGGDGGIWMSGGAITVDAQGYLYLSTGNGTFDTTLNSAGMPAMGDYGDTVLKLAVDPTTSASSQNVNGWGLRVVDYFTPFNQATLSANDTDLGSGVVLILPDSAGSPAHPHLLLTAGKEGKLYLIDRDNMGHFDPNIDHVVQEVPGALNAQLGNPAYFNGGVYYATPGFGTDVAKVFSISNGVLSTSPTSTSPDTFTWRGGTTSISAGGTSDGIMWALDGGTNQLRAYDATDLGHELYTSAQAGGGRDRLGTVVKFTVPTVTNGHVYVGVDGALVGYGLLP